MKKIEYDERVLKALEVICVMVMRESTIDLLSDIGKALENGNEMVGCDPTKSAYNSGRNAAAHQIYTTFKEWYKPSDKKDDKDEVGK